MKKRAAPAGPGATPVLSAEELIACREAWRAMTTQGSHADVLRHPAVLRVARYAYTRGIAHGEPARARPLSVYENGDTPRDLSRGGKAGVVTVRELATFFKGQAKGPPRAKGKPPFLSVGATSTGRRRNVDIDTNLGVGFIALDCDYAGTSSKLSAETKGLAHVLHESPTGGPTKWRVWIPLRTAWLPDAALLEEEREHERVTGDEKDTGFEKPWHQRYAVARLVFGALARLKGSGFDQSTNAPANRMYPGHPTPENPKPRKVRWSEGVAFDIDAALAALEELGVVVEEAPTRRRSARRREFKPDELISPADLAAAIEPIATAIRAHPYVGHKLYLALAGSLIDAGVPHAHIPNIVVEICTAAGNPRAETRYRDATETINRSEAGLSYTTLWKQWPSVAVAVRNALPAPPRRVANRVIESLPSSVERVSVNEGRALTAAAFTDLISGELLLIKGSPGVGKTTAAATWIASSQAKVIVLARDSDAVDAWTGRLSGRGIHVVPPRNILAVLNDDGTQACRFPDAAEEMYAAGLSPRGPLCRGFQGSVRVGSPCPYLKNCKAANIQHLSGRVAVATHAMAPFALSEEGWESATVIVDESPNELVKQVKLTPAALRSAAPLAPHVLSPSTRLTTAAVLEFDRIVRGTQSESVDVALKIASQVLADAIGGAVEVTPEVFALNARRRWRNDLFLWKKFDRDLDFPLRASATAPSIETVLTHHLPALCRALFPERGAFLPPASTADALRTKFTKLSVPSWSSHHGVRALVALFTRDDKLKAQTASEAAKCIHHEIGSVLHVARLAPLTQAIAAHGGTIIVLDGTGDPDSYSAAFGRPARSVNILVREGAAVRRIIMACPDANRSNWCANGKANWKSSLGTALRLVIDEILSSAPKGASLVLATFPQIETEIEAGWNGDNKVVANLLERLRGHLRKLHVTHYEAQETRGSNSFEEYDVSVSLGDPIPNITQVELEAKTLELPPEDAPRIRARAGLGQFHDRLRGVPRDGARLLSIHVGVLCPDGQWDKSSVSVAEMPMGRPRGPCDVTALVAELLSLTRTVADAAAAAGVSVGVISKAKTDPVSDAIRVKIQSAVERLRGGAAGAPPAPTTE